MQPAHLPERQKLFLSDLVEEQHIPFEVGHIYTKKYFVTNLFVRGEREGLLLVLKICEEFRSSATTR